MTKAQMQARIEALEAQLALARTCYRELKATLPKPLARREWIYADKAGQQFKSVRVGNITRTSPVSAS